MTRHVIEAQRPAPDGAKPPVDRAGAGPDRVAPLRGAGVDVNARLVGRVLGVGCLVALTVVAVVLLVAGLHDNAQIDALRDHGRPVTVTVTGCMGLLGGSGSNGAGYACTGSFTFDGHTYREAIPGMELRNPGSHVAAVAVAGDPPLLSTRSAVASEHASAGVFLWPLVLLGFVAAGVVAVVVAARRRPKPA